MHTTESKDLMDKLTILSDAAKYDVACTSSGVARRGDGKSMGNTRGSGICHAFTADGRCISLLKILFTNTCIYDCKYCVNRVSNDVPRVSFTPEEVCTLTMEFYRRNYIEGLFLSSGIVHSPDFTMGLLYETLFLLRNKYGFHGYIHIKGIPGASEQIVEQVGYLCDRMSVNLELPTAEGLRQVAPNKLRRNILRPMRQIQESIKESRLNHGVDSMQARLSVDERSYYNQLAEIRDSYERMVEERKNHILTAGGTTLAEKVAEESWQFGQTQTTENKNGSGRRLSSVLEMNRADVGIERPFASQMRDMGGSTYPGRESGLTHNRRYFVPAGQSTQMIVGATGETDYQIISVTEALYNRFELKRVFYSAFINVNGDETLPSTLEGPPLLREHRLYQADFLLRFYGFAADELLSPSRPNFHRDLDPKCYWAVQHLEQFPVEINRADYYTLLRVPGIGTKSARRILAARKHARLGFEDIKKMGVVLKRALYFITCMGKMFYPTKIEEGYITRHLIYNDRPDRMLLPGKGETEYQQISLWDCGVSI